MINSAFVSLRMPIHPASVQCQVGKWHQNLSPVVGPSGRVLVGRRLWLAADRRPPNPDRSQLYAVKGLLWMSGRPIRVDLEFSMWSATVTEVGLRPAHLLWPVRTERYGRQAAQLLEEIIGAVTGCVALEPAGAGETVSTYSWRAGVSAVA